MKRVILFFSFLFQCVSFAATSATSEFDYFKSLKGKWSMRSSGKPIPVEMIYDSGSKDSIVTEQFGKELTVFYKDGSDLLMTHFCNIGNQPRLKLKANSLPGLIEFEVFDITNLKNETSPHVQKIIYKIIDDKNFDLEIVWKKGSVFESEKYSLIRK